MVCYHRTRYAAEILNHGFRDGEGSYGLRDDDGEPFKLKGVFFSDQPLDEGQGAYGDVVLTMEIPEVELAEYEIGEEGKGYREFCIPATVANQYGPPTIHQEE